MRRMLVSRSSFENPRPFDRLVRTSSPSSISTFRPRVRSSVASSEESVVFPAPDKPVNHKTNPLLISPPIQIVFRKQLRQLRSIDCLSPPLAAHQLIPEPLQVA